MEELERFSDRCGARRLMTALLRRYAVLNVAVVVRAPIVMLGGVIAVVGAKAVYTSAVSDSGCAVHAAHSNVARTILPERVERKAGGHGGPDKLVS